MQPIIHDFAGYRVILEQTNGRFQIRVTDGNLDDVDSFIETDIDQAALQFEQAIYNLHTANGDDEYHLPLMDFTDEDQFQILGELSYKNYVKERT